MYLALTIPEDESAYYESCTVLDDGTLEFSLDLTDLISRFRLLTYNVTLRLRVTESDGRVYETSPVYQKLEHWQDWQGHSWTITIYTFYYTVAETIYRIEVRDGTKGDKVPKASRSTATEEEQGFVINYKYLVSQESASDRRYHEWNLLEYDNLTVDIREIDGQNSITTLDGSRHTDRLARMYEFNIVTQPISNFEAWLLERFLRSENLKVVTDYFTPEGLDGSAKIIPCEVNDFQKVFVHYKDQDYVKISAVIRQKAPVISSEGV